MHRHNAKQATRRAFLISALIGTALPGAVIAGGGDGGGNTDSSSSSGSGSSTQSRPKLKVITVRDFLRRNRAELEKMNQEMQSGGRKYQIRGFSPFFSRNILTAAVNDRRQTRRIVEAMDKIKGKKRKAFLDQELQKAGEKHDNIRATARKLRKDAQKAYRARNDSSEAMKRWEALNEMATEENTRQQRAKNHMGFIRDWKRDVKEGTYDD